MVVPGKIARRLLGRNFDAVGRIYRRFFVDLERVADVFSQQMPMNAKILDIGGGDGALVDRLLRRRPDLKITMCDLAPSIGAFLSEEHRRKVRLLPATDFSQVSGPFDAVTISDVIHHVPVEGREAFFEGLAMNCRRWGCRKIILKDIEPGGVRATLSLIADRYITGDRHVVLFSPKQFDELAARYFPNADVEFKMPDWPNYCEVLTW